MMHRLDPAAPIALPDYFVDRYAARRHPLLAGPWATFEAKAVPSRPPAARAWKAVLRPSDRLDGWIPKPESLTQVGRLYRRLACDWKQFVSDQGLPPAAGVLPDASVLTWAEILHRSVHYPGPPVFAGANYLDALSQDQAQHLLAQYGARGAIDFFCFMAQVHEHMHFLQTGEPLLNEVVQAATWTAFLSNRDYAFFQGGDDLGLVREYRVVSRQPRLLAAAIDSSLDTAATVRRLGVDGTYFACCALACAFDLGRIRYGGYLDKLDSLLDVAHDLDAVRETSRHALELLNTP